jgi:ATP-binding cassette subfamily B protein
VKAAIWPLIAPAKRSMVVSAILSGTAAALRVAPCVALTEGIKEVKNFQGASSVQTCFADARSEFTAASYASMSKSGRATALLSALFQPAAVFATVLPAIVVFLDRGWVEAPHALPFVILTLGIPSGLLALIGLAQQLGESVRAARDTAEILSIPPMPHGATGTGGGPSPGAVSFEKVTFGYDKASSRRRARPASTSGSCECRAGTRPSSARKTASCPVAKSSG